MKYYFGLLLLLLNSMVPAQNVAINADGSTAHASAMLDIKNPNKGLLIPRVSLLSDLDVTTISNPQLSLLVYNNNNALPDGDGYYYWNGAKWTKLATRVNLANLAWNIAGNTGTNPANDFIGTTDNKPLVFKTNNTLSGKIDPVPNNTFFGNSAGMLTNSGVNNSFFGQYAGQSNTTGVGNLFAGHNAGAGNISGSSNVFLGQGAGKSNGFSSNIVCIGEDAGFNNLRNGVVAIGANALYSSISGDYSTAVGFQSMYSNTYGDENTAIGYQSLYSNTLGSRNTAVGVQALLFNDLGSFNTAVGYWALANNIGANNDAFGYEALKANIAGMNNAAFGSLALHSNISGDGNIAMGHLALYDNTTGNNNSVLGLEAMRSNTTGSDNTALGHLALFSNTNGYENVAIGDSAQSNNVSGFQNTSIGNLSMTANLNGDKNSAFGYSSGPSLASLNNTTAIGYKAIVSTSNTMVFGDGNVDRWAFGIPTTNAQHALEVGNAAANGNGAYLTQGGNWTNTSDISKKEDFSDLNPAELLQKISQLSIRRWKYKGTNEYHIGPTAQQFYRLFNVGTDDKGISTVDPAGIALAAIQEQQKIIQQQHEMIVQLKRRIDLLEKINK
ncbi:MAG: tail fiber domain-containing protein [Ferruginibacter sp.]